MLFVIRCLVFVGCWLRFDVCGLLVCCVVNAGCRVMPVVCCCVLFDVNRLLCVVC